MTAPVSPNASHATYAPSAAHRWMHCTASALAISQLPPEPEGEAATAGTEAHAELERCLSEWDEQSVDFRGGMPISPDPNHSAAEAVALALDYIRQLPEGTLWVEQRVRLTDDIWGRCDVAHWDDAAQVLTIVDLKNGFVPVEAVRNEQTRIYAAGTIYTRNLPAKWIRYAIVQPNDFRPVPRVKQWVESATDLYEFANRAAAVPTGPLTFTAGEHCRYCPLFGRCQPTRDLLVRLADVLAHPASDVKPDQVAPFIVLKKPIEDFFKGLDKAQLKEAMAGKVAPGMKLVETIPRRAWKDEAAARAFVLAEKGVDALSPPSPAQAEKMGLSIEGLADRPKGVPALALESDWRQEWRGRDVVEMFKGVA